MAHERRLHRRGDSSPKPRPTCLGLLGWALVGFVAGNGIFLALGLGSGEYLDGQWLSSLVNPNPNTTSTKTDVPKDGPALVPKGAKESRRETTAVPPAPVEKKPNIPSSPTAPQETTANNNLMMNQPTLESKKADTRNQTQKAILKSQEPGRENPESTWKYDYAEVRQEVMDYAHKWIHTDNCEKDPKALVARCCTHFVCGGMADRVRGLLLLTQVAEKANRRLCLPRDYFIPTARPKCLEGPYMIMLSSTFMVYKNPMEPRVRPHATRMTSKVDPTVDNPGSSVRYISTVRNGRSRSLGIMNSQDIKRFGMLAISLSRSMAKDMSTSQRRLESCFKSRLADESHVAFHIRCGGSLYTDKHGDKQVAVQKWADGYNTSIPDDILRVARNIPRHTVCTKRLYISTDSLAYRAELKKALPKGIRTIACSEEPLHVGFSKPVSSTGALEHLVDLEALGTADAIFKTVGGFAELGAVTMGWASPRIYSWPQPTGLKNLSDAEKWQIEEKQRNFIQLLLIALDCNERGYQEVDESVGE